MDFQLDHGLTADGVVGMKTWQAIRDAVSGSGTANAKYDPVIYNLSWKKYYKNIIQQGLDRNDQATLTDIGTGKTFTIKVQSSGSTHVDAEPLTAADTAILCQIYGVTSASKLPYTRRGMVVTAGGMQFVCSIYPQPHGQQNITNNNFGGQFCIHFLDSTINSGDGGSVSDSKNHQAIIAAAVKKLKTMKIN